MEEMVQMSKFIVLKQGYHAPMLFLDGTIANAPMILGKFPNEHEDKITYLYLAGKHFSDKHQIGKLNKVFLVMEAWMGMSANIRPSRDPNRIEALIVACLDIRKNEQTVATLEYLRNADGNLIEIKDTSIPNGTKAESPLLPAFVAGFNGK